METYCKTLCIRWGEGMWRIEHYKSCRGSIRLCIDQLPYKGARILILQGDITVHERSIGPNIPRPRAICRRNFLTLLHTHFIERNFPLPSLLLLLYYFSDSKPSSLPPVALQDTSYLFRPSWLNQRYLRRHIFEQIVEHRCPRHVHAPGDQPDGTRDV